MVRRATRRHRLARPLAGSGVERVRSQTIGALELIGVPGASDTSASIGSTWQSVDVQYTSVPLVIVKTWALVPAFMHADVLAGVRDRDRQLRLLAALYDVLSVTASTVIFSGAHGSPSTAAGSVGIVVASGVAGAAVGVSRRRGARVVALTRRPGARR